MLVEPAQFAEVTKTCTGCLLDLPLSEFRIRTDRDGRRHSRCHGCINNTTVVAAKKRRIADPLGASVRDRKSNLKRYGLTEEEFIEMAEEQEWLCAICRKDIHGINLVNGKRMAHVDHDHESGKVRGLLCNNCNRGIGLLGDSAEILSRASQYLSGYEAAARGEVFGGAIEQECANGACPIR